MIDKDEIARETNEMLVWRFVAAVGYDYKQDYSPHIYPIFSEDTVALWEEIERRMTAPECLNFHYNNCLAEIRRDIATQSDILKGGVSYMTSYHYGIRSGLDMALGAIKRNVRADNG